MGALLATPADLERPLPPGYPTLEALAQNGWLPVPRKALPFPSIVGASANDPLASHERTLELAGAWGSRVVELGDVGHLNPAAGFGPWPQAATLLRATLLTTAGRVTETVARHAAGSGLDRSQVAPACN